MDNTPSIMAHNDKAEQKTKGDGVNYEEIACRCHVHMILKKSTPGLGRRLSMLVSVLVDRGIGDVVPEKEKLRFDPRCSPRWIFLRHLEDQRS